MDPYKIYPHISRKVKSISKCPFLIFPDPWYAKWWCAPSNDTQRTALFLWRVRQKFSTQTSFNNTRPCSYRYLYRWERVRSNFNLIGLSELGERPHVCVHCGKSFAHKHCLNTHLLLHSTDRPFQCNECKKSFTLKHHLLTHSRVSFWKLNF